MYFRLLVAGALLSLPSAGCEGNIAVGAVLAGLPTTLGPVDSTIEGRDYEGLIRLHAALVPQCQDGSRTIEANRLQLRVRDRLRALEADSDARFASRVRDARVAGVHYWDPAEDDLVRPILGSDATRFTTVSVPWHGRKQSLEIADKVEWERRVAVTLPGRYREEVPLRGLPDLVAVLLDATYGVPLAEVQSPRLSPRPLGSLTTHFHGNSRTFLSVDGPVASPFNVVVPSRLDIRVDDDAFYFEYRVSHQRERGTYFDTPAGELRARNVALRRKEWFTIPQRPGEASVRTGRAWFVKVTGASDTLFTRRRELELHLPGDADEALEREARKALLHEVGVVLSGDPRPFVEVDNERYGFDLYWRHRYKIGFFTVDRFTSKAAKKEHGPFHQWEIELLPEWRPLFERNRVEFEHFFRRIETEFGGRLNPTPKYREHIDS